MVSQPPLSEQLVDLGLGPYVHTQPSQRFPVYTRGNAGEVWPHVAYPLSISISSDLGGRSYQAAVAEVGLMSEDEMAEGMTMFGGCFGGYMYINLSFSRVMAIRSPGTTIEESDATFLGSEGLAPPYVEHPNDKSWRATLRSMRYGFGVLRHREAPEIDLDRAWITRRLAAMEDPSLLSNAELTHRFDELLDDFGQLFTRHLVVSGRAGAMVSLLAKICDDNFGDRSLAFTMLGGLGEVDSAAPSFELWDLGRVVAADPALTAHFDAGVSGLWQRLEADPRATAFVEVFARFVDNHGARGPNEWESASDTWGTDPELALALVDRMRGADDRQAPALRTAELADKREQAVAAARAQLKGPQRWLFNNVLRSAALYSQGRERTKTTVIRAIHAIRLSNRELGRRLANASGGQRDDLYFVLHEELEAYVADPEAFADTIAQRRRTRNALAERVPPFVFEGEMPSADTWPLRTNARGSVTSVVVGEVLTGLAACPGIAEGIARVVLDPSDPGDLGPGDVLVAPLTDPAWTPLFVPAEAVVVDVGGQMSHAVIVSRELGLPCVVAATDASTRIPNGARIRVDGAAGTVTILEMP